MSLLLNWHDHGYTLAAGVFWLWLLGLGHLAYQSTRYPGVLRILLIVSLIVATVIELLWPRRADRRPHDLLPPAVADLWLIAYLVNKGGIRVPAKGVVLTSLSTSQRSPAGRAKPPALWMQRTTSPYRTACPSTQPRSRQ